jgi:hypothetical protein
MRKYLVINEEAFSHMNFLFFFISVITDDTTQSFKFIKKIK